MQIILWRHAPALARDPELWPDDSERPLSDRGQRRASRVSTGLARLVQDVDAIWSSPAARAFQTADILRHVHPRRPPLQTLAELSPGAPLGRLVETLDAARGYGAIILVGHEPTLGRLAAVLLGGPRSRLVLPLKKAGAVCLRMAPEATAGRAELEWWLPPSVLRRIS